MWICLNLLPPNDKDACSEAVAAQAHLTAAEKTQYHPGFKAERLDRTNLKIFDFEPPRPAKTLSELSSTRRVKSL